MRMRILSLALLFFLPLFAEEYKVRLSTQESLYSLELSQVEKRAPSFKAGYLNQLKEVLSFDLAHSGFFVLTKDNSGRGNSAFVIKPIAEKNEFYLEFWSSYGKGRSADHKDVNYHREKIRKISKRVSLKGMLARDRRQIHILANAFLKQAIGKKSVFENRILYSVRIEKRVGQWLSEIWICDWDGANARQVTFENSYCLHPLFLSKNSFLYVSYRSGFPKIYVSSLAFDQTKRIDKANSRPLVSLRGNQLLPALSRDKRQLSFISDAAGRPDLFMQPLNGNFQPSKKPLQLFSFPRATQASSSFSPSGSRLAFVSDKDGTPRVYWINIHENSRGRKRPKAHLITLKNRGNVTPSWSLDGTKIAYSAKINGVRQIWLYDFENKEERQLTFDGKNKENPDFAFDNLHIVYNTEDKSEAELYIVNIQDSSVVKIGRGVGRKRFPVFEQN